MSKKIMTLLLAVFLVAAFSVPAAVAMWGQKCCGKSMDCKGAKGKFMGSVHKILKQQDELDLTNKQVKQIKALSVDVRKKLIRQGAEIKTLGVDIKTKMGEKPLDVKGVNALIARKHNLKSAKEQELVSACGKLTGILTAEQQKKLKSCKR